MYPMIQDFENFTLTEALFPMPDGVGLYTRLLVPKGGGQYPIVFIRTPYSQAYKGKPCPLDENLEVPYIRHGYTVVLQHCRGTGDSQGICIPYKHERSDALETLSMIRKLPFYNGEIYLLGGSYLATVHFSYLDPCPPDIRGAALSVQTDRMFFRNYRNGCCYNFCNLSWWLRMMQRQYPGARAKAETIPPRPYKDLMKKLVGEDVPDYTANLLNDTYNEFWQNDPRTNVIENWKIPVLFTEGWYDFYTEGMCSMWQRLPEAVKQVSAFVVGPWGHATKTARNCPYPLPEGNIPADFALRWFNSLRDHTPYPYARTGMVNYYSVGGGKWNTAHDFTPGNEGRRLYFREDLSLSDTPCTGADSVTYTYDPEKAPRCFRYQGIYEAPAPNTVPGVISFLSAPFDREQDFFGTVHWHMTVSSDCEDTAFFIRVYLTEEGKSYNLTETITSLSHADPDYRAGKQITLTLDTPPMAFTVKKGAAVRVDISSHSDIYVPHANIKGHWAEVTETKIAHNTLHLKNACITLPADTRK